MIRSTVEDETTMGREGVETLVSTDDTTVYDVVEGGAERTSAHNVVGTTDVTPRTTAATASATKTTTTSIAEGARCHSSRCAHCDPNQCYR